MLDGSKALPDRDALFSHLMRAYVDDRAGLVSLVEPCVPGAVFYRVMAAEKAERRRERAMQQGKEPAMPTTERGKRRRSRSVIENRKPRTVLELKKSVYDAVDSSWFRATCWSIVVLALVIRT